MAFRILSFLWISILVAACADNRLRKAPPVSSSPDELVTGCYYIVEDSTAVKRTVLEGGSTVTCYIDRRPIITVGDFEEAEVKERDPGYSLNVKLNEKGTREWAIATRTCVGKRIAFIIYNELVMAPIVQHEITSGDFEINGSFEKAELDGFLGMIHHEMYEQ